MDALVDRGCFNCRWWQPYDTGTGEPETGVCSSVNENDYASVTIESQDSAPPVFVTYANFWCRDHQDEEE